MKVHIIVGMMQGVVEDVRAFDDEKKADEAERKMCEEYDVPYDEDKRREYRDYGQNDVLTFIVDVE